MQLILALGLALSFPASSIQAQESVKGRKSLVFRGVQTLLVVDLAGGSIANFHFNDLPLNPLQWATPEEGDPSIRGFGHFLCLDRWGPPSDAEGANGMPYHGEAARVEWTTVSEPAADGDFMQAEMSASLPLAGLAIHRTIRSSREFAVFMVREQISNKNKLGRVLNCVQHPTIGPPFLDESTIVDCNGVKGFAQGNASAATPEEPSFEWPNALKPNGQRVDMRRLADDPAPNVVSYAIDAAHGWVTAVTPGKGLLIGYVWKTSDYPWVSLWRDVREGRPSARGLEFGSTGLHQPFPILTKKGRIFGRPLFEFLDANQSMIKSYAVFLLKVPTDFAGVGSLAIEKDRISLNESPGSKGRTFIVESPGLLQQLN